MPVVTLAEYIKALKATAPGATISAIIADQNVAKDFRGALQMSLPHPFNHVARRDEEAVRSMPVQMPGDPYSGGDR